MTSTPPSPASAPSPGALPDRDSLHGILSRAVTLTNGPCSPCVDDDLRMLRDLGARFVGRSAYVWKTKTDDDGHFERAGAWARRAHDQVDADLVLQAAIFEAVFPEVQAIRIPPWVFEDLGEPVEQRHFRFDDMLGKVRWPAPWDGSMVPDITRPETFRWFYYRARRYLACGYEALHLGQVHLIGGVDRGYRQYQRLCAAIRQAAAAHARRGWVILDGHGHGIAIDGRLLFDFTSRPLTARCLRGMHPHVALAHRGRSLGGVHPGGWTCDQSPTLVEVDNWGGYSMEPDAPGWSNLDRRAEAGSWGYDQIAWFARLPETDRRGFLHHAHQWARLQHPACFFQPAVARSLGRADIVYADRRIHRYRANRPSAACPEGTGDETFIREVWSLPPTPAAAPASAASPSETGLTVPEPITVTGQLQPLLGGIGGDASCPWSRLHPVGPGRFERTFALPLAGRFTFTVASGGTNSDPVNQGGIVGGPPWTLLLPEPGMLVRITYHHDHRTVEATDPLTGRSLLTGH